MKRSLKKSPVLGGAIVELIGRKTRKKKCEGNIWNEQPKKRRPGAARHGKPICPNIK